MDCIEYKVMKKVESYDGGVTYIDSSPLITYLSDGIYNEDCCSKSNIITPITEFNESNIEDYICELGVKYKKLVKQISFDNGVTYQDVVPYECKKGDSLGESIDCIKNGVFNINAINKVIGEVTERVGYKTYDFYSTIGLIDNINNHKNNLIYPYINNTSDMNIYQQDYIDFGDLYYEETFSSGKYLEFEEPLLVRDNGIKNKLTIIFKIDNINLDNQIHEWSCGILRQGYQENLNYRISISKQYGVILTCGLIKYKSNVPIRDGRPNVISVRVDNNNMCTIKNHTFGDECQPFPIKYGEPSEKSRLTLNFNHADETSDIHLSYRFYWLYGSDEYLSNEDIGVIIDANEKRCHTQYSYAKLDGSEVISEFISFDYGKTKKSTLYYPFGGFYNKWIAEDITKEWICENGNKYYKEYQYKSKDGINFIKTDITRKGILFEEDSPSCGFPLSFKTKFFIPFVDNGEKSVFNSTFNTVSARFNYGNITNYVQNDKYIYLKPYPINIAGGIMVDIGKSNTDAFTFIVKCKINNLATSTILQSYGSVSTSIEHNYALKCTNTDFYLTEMNITDAITPLKIDITKEYNILICRRQSDGTVKLSEYETNNMVSYNLQLKDIKYNHCNTLMASNNVFDKYNDFLDDSNLYYLYMCDTALSDEEIDTAVRRCNLFN